MSLTLTLGALGLFAQPTGFGGFQMPKVDVRCSQKIADVDYAGGSPTIPRGWRTSAPS